MFLIVWEILGLNGEWWRKDVYEWDIRRKFFKLIKREWYVHLKSLSFLYDNNTQIDFTKIDTIISRWAHFRYDANLLSKFPNLKRIYLLQIWNDNVDLDYCREKWIEVKNFVSQKSVYSVAELTVWSLIMWVRQAFNLWCSLKNWVYTRSPLWKNLEWITIWVMWFGRIGQKVVELLQIFPCKIIAYDVLYTLTKSFPISSTLEKLLNNGRLELTWDLDYFLRKSDYITIHIPWTKENRWILNYDKLKYVRWVVNMSRAWVVKEEDILKLLNEWKLEFYVTDVVEGEPDISKIRKELINHERVFITPHIGANTLQVQYDILKMLVEGISNSWDIWTK